MRLEAEMRQTREALRRATDDRAHLQRMASVGQEIAARHYFRPRNAEVAKQYSANFPPLRLFTIDEAFGGWAKAQAKHFDDRGVFDQVATAKR